MIYISSEIAIANREIRYDFIRASGPGGQNVNKVATAVQLRFDLGNSTSLPQGVKDRLRKLAGQKLSAGGILVIQASRFKSQDKNRQDALDRLVRMIRQAAVKPKKRVKTRPSRQARQRRLEAKRHRSRLKHDRQPVKDNPY